MYHMIVLVSIYYITVVTTKFRSKGYSYNREYTEDNGSGKTIEKKKRKWEKKEMGRGNSYTEVKSKPNPCIESSKAELSSLSGTN